MLCRPVLGLCISIAAFAAGPSTTVATFSNSTITAATVDATGGIYVTGYQGPTLATSHAFVAKLSAAGSILYATAFAGSGQDLGESIAVDSSGAAYIAGETSSADFPVTSGVLQTVAGSGFVAKVDPKGNVVYATFLGGNSGILVRPGGLLVDAAGDVIVSGQAINGNFPSVPADPVHNGSLTAFFVAKLDSKGQTLLGAARGIGGKLALDSQGDIYIAGIDQLPSIPITPGAFQSEHQPTACGGNAFFPVLCSYQYVTKLNPDLTRIVYSTYIAGEFGATPAAINVDLQGDAWVAGTTNSADYPTTLGALQPKYIAGSPPPPQPPCGSTYCVYPPAASGYITELNPVGTHLIYSTFFGGSQDDTIAFAAFTPHAIFLSGQAGSADLTNLSPTSPECLPLTYETFLGASGTTAAEAHIMLGTPAGGVLAYDDSTGTLLAWTGTGLIRFDPFADPLQVSCIFDAADLRPVTSIAPGELLSIFGTGLAATAVIPPAGSFPTSLGGVSVAFNGLAAPLLYVAPQQINVQAPFEIAGSSAADVVLTSTVLAAPDSHTLGVVPLNPSAFLDTVTPDSLEQQCESRGYAGGYAYGGEPVPLAFNSDGTRNTCLNPAKLGTVVTLYLNGLGVTSPPPATGSVNPSPAVLLNLPITVSNVNAATVVSAIAAPSSISGVWQISIRFNGDTGALATAISVASIPVRDVTLAIWVR